jgi:hypothetical protein
MGAEWMESLLLALIGHGISDFMLQSERMVKGKQQFNWGGFVRHGLITGITLIFVLHGYEFFPVLIFAAILATLHSLIDWMKALASSRFAQRLEWAVFLIDQALHLTVIFTVWQFFTLPENSAVQSMYRALLTPKSITVLTQSVIIGDGWSANRILVMIMVYLYVCLGGSFLLRGLLNGVHLKNTSAGTGSNPQRSGALIGMAERFLILLFVQSGSLGSVAFIFTAKSIARFSELNDKIFAEYYLTGTLLSTALAIAGGFFLNYLMAIIK